MRDVVGAILSLLCIFHCSLPLLVVVFGTGWGLSFLTDIFHAEWIHLSLLVPIFIALVISLPSSYKQHKDIMPSVFAIIGSLFLIFALILGEAYETPLTVIGGLLVMAAHILNHKRNKAVDLTFA